AAAQGLAFDPLGGQGAVHRDLSLAVFALGSGTAGIAVELQDGPAHLEVAPGGTGREGDPVELPGGAPRDVRPGALHPDGRPLDAGARLPPGADHPDAVAGGERAQVAQEGVLVAGVVGEDPASALDV